MANESDIKQMEKQYIDKRSAMELAYRFATSCVSRFVVDREIETLEKLIQQISAADLVEVRRGEWLPDVYAKDTRTGYEYLTLKCSVCGCGCLSRNNFCHRCGADMRSNAQVRMVEHEHIN